MKAVRAVWAVIVAFGFFLAWFAPVALLPFLALAAVVLLRLSRRQIGRGEGHVRARAAWPAFVLLGLILAAVLIPWFQWFAAHAALGPDPNPQAIPWWMLTPVEHLVWVDPFYAGVIVPVLFVAVPCALAIAVMVALRRRD